MTKRRQSPAHGPSAAGADGDDIDALAFELHSAMLHMMRRVRREDDAFGLSAPQMSALSCVAFGTPRRLGELAAMEQVAPPTMTRLVAGLESDGYVARARDASDGRVVWIRATPKGRRVIERGRSRRVAFLVRKLRSLDDADRAALSRAADVLHRVYRSS